MQRRSFILKAIQALGIVGFASLPFGLARLMMPSRADAAQMHIPLPGALADSDEFVAACIGCGLCGEVCPPRCVKFYKDHEGSKADTPYIDPAERGCILCGLCIELVRPMP